MIGSPAGGVFDQGRHGISLTGGGVGSLSEEGRGSMGICPWHASVGATGRDRAAWGGRTSGRSEREQPREQEGATSRAYSMRGGKKLNRYAHNTWQCE